MCSIKNIREFTEFYLANMEVANKNGDLDILSHMVRPANTHDQTRGIVMKLPLFQLIIRGEDQRGVSLHHSP